MGLDLDTYQTHAAKTAIYPDSAALEYLAMGLMAECGELAGHLAKWLRNDNEGKAYPAEALLAEAGDVLWFISEFARLHNKPLSNLAQDNLDKLASRQKRGKLKGNGDYR